MVALPAPPLPLLVEGTPVSVGNADTATTRIAVHTYSIDGNFIPALTPNTPYAMIPTLGVDSCWRNS